MPSLFFFCLIKAGKGKKTIWAINKVTYTQALELWRCSSCLQKVPGCWDGRAGHEGGGEAEGGPGSILLSPPRSRSTAPLVVLTAQKVCSSQTHPLGQLQQHPKAHQSSFPAGVLWLGLVPGPLYRTSWLWLPRLLPAPGCLWGLSEVTLAPGPQTCTSFH